jgi:hypothetical protein
MNKEWRGMLLLKIKLGLVDDCAVVGCSEECMTVFSGGDVREPIAEFQLKNR